MNVLDDYAIENIHDINTEDTKIMICNKTGRLMTRIYFIDGIKIECSML